MSRNKTKKTIQKTNPPPPINIPTKSNIANDIASNIVSGFAFGAGSSIAKNAIENIFQEKSEPKQESTLHKEYIECLKHNNEKTCKIFFP